MEEATEHVEDIIEHARSLFRKKDIFWSFPLITHLESHCDGLAVKWAVIVLKKLILALDPLAYSKIESLLDNFPTETSGLDVHFCQNKCEEVWYFYSPRDEIITAISDLYGAIGNKIAGYKKTYQMCVASALGNISEHKLFRPELFDLIVETWIIEEIGARRIGKKLNHK